VRLLRAFKTWATEHGAREVALGVSTPAADAGRLGALYERMGFQPAGTIHRARIR
jgi:hypothetical protein